MDEVSVASGSSRRYVLITRLSATLAALALVYIFWRGFAAESSRRPTPLFGEVSLLEWEGHKCPFRLASFADLGALHPGERVILQGEPSAVVWRVVSRTATRLSLERQRYGRIESQDVKLPPEEGAPRYILVTPAPAE